MLNPMDIAEEVRSGHRSALSAVVLLKRMAEAVEEARKSIMEEATTEYINSGEAEVKVDGATIRKFHGRTTYEYKADTAWSQTKQKLEAREKQLKFAAKVYLEKGEEVVEEDTGEVIPVVPSSSSADSIAISLKG